MERQLTQVPTAINYEDAPLGSLHLRVAFASAGGFFSDGFGLGIIGIAMAAATPALHLTAMWEGLIGAGSLAGLFLGALLTGPVADRYGRRRIFLATMALLALSSLAQGLVSSPAQLFVLRLIVGFSLGADYVVSQAMLTEFSVKKFRGRMLGSISIAWVLGYVCAYCLGYALTDLGPNAWHWMLMSSAVPALLVLPLRSAVPESPLWLIDHGRTEEAAGIVRQHIGRHILLPSARTRTAASRPESLRRHTSAAGWRVLFSPPWRRSSFISCLFFTCQVIPYFSLGTFVPTVMSALDVKSNYAAGLVYNAFLIVGAVLGIAIIDRISRRAFLIGSFAITAVTMAALSSPMAWSSFSVIALFAIFACVISAAATLEGVYPSELFPTELRASGIGLSVAASRVGSAIGTFLLPIVVVHLGIRAALGFCVGVLALGAVACLLWAPETRYANMAGEGGNGSVNVSD